MTRRRSQIVAAQAVVVGALMVVVFLTLLGPEGNGPLFGVETPGEPGRHALLPTPGSYDTGQEDRHGGRQGSRRRPGTIRSGGAVAVGGAAPAATVPAPVAGPLPSRAGGGDGEGSPTDDQYADTLTRLRALIN